MSENAELWSYPDEASVRRTVTAWLNDHRIQYNSDTSTDDLVQLYRDIECGKYHK